MQSIAEMYIVCTKANKRYLSIYLLSFFFNSSINELQYNYLFDYSVNKALAKRNKVLINENNTMKQRLDSQVPDEEFVTLKHHDANQIIHVLCSRVSEKFTFFFWIAHLVILNSLLLQIARANQLPLDTKNRDLLESVGLFTKPQVPVEGDAKYPEEFVPPRLRTKSSTPAAPSPEKQPKLASRPLLF